MPINFATQDSEWQDIEVTIGYGFLGDDNYLDLGKEIEVPTSTFAATTTLSSTNNSDKSSCQQGCVLVIHNIDKNIRPSFQRLNSRTVSLHYCNIFAVFDRIAIGNQLQPSNRADSSTAFNISSLLPSEADIAAIKEEFEILTASKIIYTF